MSDTRMCLKSERLGLRQPRARGKTRSWCTANPKNHKGQGGLARTNSFWRRLSDACQKTTQRGQAASRGRTPPAASDHRATLFIPQPAHATHIAASSRNAPPRFSPGCLIEVGVRALHSSRLQTASAVPSSRAIGRRVARRRRRIRWARFMAGELFAIGVMIASIVAGISARFANDSLTPIFRVLPISAAVVTAILPIVFFGDPKRGRR